MLGFVEDSKGKAEIANARAAYVACQSIATEEKASGTTPSILPITAAYTLKATTATTTGNRLDTMLYTDLGTATIQVKVANGKVEQLSYLNKDKTYGVLITAGGTTTVSKGATQPSLT